MVNAYYLNDKDQTVSLEELAEIGVLYWYIDADDYEEKLSAICKERKYGHRSLVDICAGRTMQSTLDKFYEEHLHEFEEIRFIMDGNAIFDVRDKFDEWIRIELEKNELIVLPAGMYHRFTLGDSGRVKAMRLFLAEQPEPIWTPENRDKEGTESLPARLEYAQKFLGRESY